jgi:serine/threonine protein kinase
MPLSPGQVLNNRYRIVKLLGQGGFGAVYRAWDINLERPCAIKENLDTTPHAQRQFKREAQILFDLSHPNLPRVIDHFVIQGQGQYLVMEFVEGEDLQEMLDRLGGPLPEKQILEWITQVCNALDYLHSQHPPIIHRDIKPANIKITPGGKAVLVDFGIAKVFDPKLSTTMGARAVTPGYSPQEQYGTGSTDARTDVYALGATLYHLLTGAQPPDSIQRNINDTLVSPRALNPAASAEVETAILKAMKPLPQERYDSVSQFKEALKLSSAPTPMLAQTMPAPQTRPSVSTYAQAVPGGPATRKLSSLSLKKWQLALGVAILAAVGLIFVIFGGGGDISQPATSTSLQSSVSTAPSTATQTTIPSATLEQIALVSDTPLVTLSPQMPLAVEKEFDSTITPNPDAVFSPLTFTDGLDALYRPLQPGTLFQNPINHMYAIFSYKDMVVGSQWTALWYRNGELVHYETIPWNGGSGGQGYTDWQPDSSEWHPGEYEVQIFLGLQWKISGVFLVEGEPGTPMLATAPPTPTLPSGTVQGRVLWNEQPVEGATVYVLDLYSFDSTQYGSSTTDASGLFSISGIPEGEQYLYVFGNQPEFWVTAVTPVQMMAEAGTLSEDTYLCKGFDPISPQDGQAISTSRPILQWGAYPDAVDYAVRVIRVGESNFVFQRGDYDARIKGTSVQVDIDLSPGEYNWRVDAFNAAGHIIGCSYFPNNFKVTK